MESVCDLCGANHATSCCSLIKDAKAVPNNKTLSLARLSLPPELELVTMADGSETVKSKSTLSKNTMFGPFDAPSTRLLSPLITFPLKVFVSARTAKSTGFYYLDTTDEATSNWMRFVRGTVTGFQKWREQNLMCYQIDGNVFYIASRDILEGEELKVGYSPNYAKKMGLPATIGPKHGTTTQEVLAWMQTEAKAASARAVSSLPDSALGVPDSKSCAAWRCQTCDRADFDSVAQYAAHLRLHYKAQKGADGGTRRSSKKIKCLGCCKEFLNKNLYEKHRCELALNAEGEDMDTSEELDVTFDPDSTTEVNVHSADNVGLLNESLDNLLREFERNADAVVASDDDDNAEMLLSVDPKQINKFSPMKERATSRLNEMFPTRERAADGSNRMPSTKERGTGAIYNFIDDSDFLFGNHDELSNFSTSTEVAGVSGDDFLTAPDPSGLGGEFYAGISKGRAYGVNGFGRANGGTDANGFDRAETRGGAEVERDTVYTDLVEAFGSNISANGIRPAYTTMANASYAFDMDVSANGFDSKTTRNGDKVSTGDGLADVSFTNVINELPNADTMEGIDDLSFLQGADVEQLDNHERMDGNERLDDCERMDDNEQLNKDEQLDDDLLGDEEEDLKEGMADGYRCDICDSRFMHKYGLYRHLKKHTGEFTCPTCLNVFARKENLVKHACVQKAYVLDRTVVRPRLKCDLCDKEFPGTDPRQLTRHMHSTHLGTWKCPHCRQSFSSKHYLLRHRCKEAPAPPAAAPPPPPQPHVCPHCSAAFHSAAYLGKHRARVHGPAQLCGTCGKRVVGHPAHEAYCTEAAQLAGDGVAKCPVCYAMFVDVLAFRRHALRHTHLYACDTCHLPFATARAKQKHRCGPLECDVCRRSLATYPALGEHSATHGVAGWHCFECGFSYLSEEGLSSHECASRGFLAANEKPPPVRPPEPPATYVCEVCGTLFASRIGLLSHMQTSHSEPKFVCDVCEKRFHRMDLLQFHSAVHLKPRIPCPHPGCSSVLTTTKILASHMRQHAGPAHVCATCGKGYHQRQLLEAHQGTAHGGPNGSWKCELCSKTFRSAHYYLEHRRRHDADGKLFKCTEDGCTKSYVTARQLQNHRASSHSGHRYVCPVCGKIIESKSSMKRHLINKHQLKVSNMNDLLASIHRNVKDLPPAYFIPKNTAKTSTAPDPAGVVANNFPATFDDTATVFDDSTTFLDSTTVAETSTVASATVADPIAFVVSMSFVDATTSDDASAVLCPGEG